MVGRGMTVTFDMENGRNASQILDKETGEVTQVQWCDEVSDMDFEVLPYSCAQDAKTVGSPRQGEHPQAQNLTR